MGMSTNHGNGLFCAGDLPGGCFKQAARYERQHMVVAVPQVSLPSLTHSRQAVVGGARGGVTDILGSLLRQATPSTLAACSCHEGKQTNQDTVTFIGAWTRFGGEIIVGKTQCMGHVPPHDGCTV